MFDVTLCAAVAMAHVASHGHGVANRRATIVRPVLAREAPGRPRRGSHNVYAAATATHVPRRLRGIRELAYVPNSGDGTVDVIDPATYRVIRRFRVGNTPHHITPSWDMRRLYVDNTGSSTLTVLDPRRAKPVGTVGVTDPYNLYFTPDGRQSIVVAESQGRLDFRRRRTWKLLGSVPIPWAGADHLDFSADGRSLLVSCEFSGMVARVSVTHRRLTGAVSVGGLPVDVKLSPDGRVYYVANQGTGGVSVLDARTLRVLGFLPTGRGAHGLLISRDARSMYVSNRLGGTISVIDLRRRRVRATWHVGGSPDMGGLTPDGRQIWITGRFNHAVYVIDSRSGRLLRTIQVGAAPHGMTFFPAPGRYSLGHNGVYR
jgi:YVTN family beta-propeller protein